MIKIIRGLLDNDERRKFLILIGQIIIVSLLEFTGIALVLPFIRYAGGELDMTQFTSFVPSSFDNPSDTIVWIGFIIFFLIVISTLAKIYLAWREQKFVWDISHRLSHRQHKNILSKPYVFFLEKNSSEIITNLIVETSTTVRGVLLPFAQIISNALIAVLFLGLITFLHPNISLLLIGLSLFTGISIFLLLKNKLTALGKKRLKLERSRYLQLKESIIGIKTLKSNSKETFFAHKFEQVSETYSNIKPLVNTLNSVPRYIMDILLFGGVALLVSIIVYQGGSVNNLLPKLTFYVLVGFKLLPTFQNIVNSIITIRFSYPSTKAVFEGLDETSNIKLKSSTNRLPFSEDVQLLDCSFSHIDNENVIDNISLKIKKGQKIGIVGYSGSGKTTLVEIISGLLFPTQGKLLIDSEEVTEHNLNEWLNNIAFIPQNVFFFDDTVLRNITFEDETENISIKKLQSILDQLGLRAFIDSLPNGLYTRLGELGVKISGGQKQRIGFARALYRNPEILILDESTSAMDYITEQELLNNLKEQKKELTVIKVAHRLKSVKDCDIIYFIDKGRIAAQGSFDEISKNSNLFKDMVMAGTI